MKIKVPGLHESEVRKDIKLPGWYLVECKRANIDIARETSVLNTEFVVAEGPFAGFRFTERFYLTDKAKSRLHCFLSRGGYPQELLKADELDDEQVVGLRIWAKLKEETPPGYDMGFVKIDGWNMRPADSPPQEEAAPKAIDYAELDAREIEREILASLDE